MPTEVKMWRIEEDKPKSVEADKLNLESRLENWIRDDIGLVNDGLLVIGQQVPTDHTGEIDLLAMDSEANLVILELKRDRTPRDIVAQILDYASYVQKLGLSEIREIASNADFLNGKSLEDTFSEKFGADLPEFVNQAHRKYIVASSLDSATERIVAYLSETHGVDINVATFAYFNVDGQEMIGRSMLLDEEAVQTRVVARSGSKRRESLTQAELREIAEKNRVVELWDKAYDGFLPISQGRTRSLSTLSFQVRIVDVGLRAFLSIIPGWSSAERGLVLRVRDQFISECFNIPEDEIQGVCGEEVKDFPDVWGGERFFDADRLDGLIKLLRENAPTN